jgi:hypothetical protein
MEWFITFLVVAVIAVFVILQRSSQNNRQARAASPSKPATTTYFDAFFDLAMRLSRNLALSEWATGTPQGYTPEEAESIEATRQARSRLSYTTTSRFVEEPLQKLLCETGLINWAREDRTSSYDEWGTDLPAENLESITSTFLKSWLCNSNPFVLLELADFLAEVGRPSEASLAVDVALKFPAYAKTVKMSDMEMVAQTIAFELFPPGPSRDARSMSQGLFSPKALVLLSEEVERIQDKLKELETEGSETEDGTEEEQSAGIADRLDPSQNPDPERVKQLWEAWEQEGEAGILKALQDHQNPPSLPKTDVPRRKHL